MTEETQETRRVLVDIDSIAMAQAAVSPGSDGQFWRTLGQKHRALIAERGFENFKRTINFEYGQWGVSSLRNAYTWRLVRMLLEKRQFPFGIFARPDFSDAQNIYWPDEIHGQTGDTIAAAKASPLKLIAYAIYCGLLWQYAATKDALGCLNVPEPTFGNPMPIWFRKRLISQDLAMASLDVNAMANYASLGSVKRVLEIGAGYGRTAYLYRRMFPNAQYFIVDIAPALAVSQNYLATVFGEDAVSRCGAGTVGARALNFLLPHQLDAMPDDHFDLVINISSFDEMPPEVSTGYLKAIGRVCRGHFYLNGHARTSDRGMRLGLEELPYDPAWRLLYSGPRNVDRFIEKIFEIP
jgi:SAM-dependent methyltransferase